MTSLKIHHLTTKEECRLGPPASGTLLFVEIHVWVWLADSLIPLWVTESLSFILATKGNALSLDSTIGLWALLHLLILP